MIAVTNVSTVASDLEVRLAARACGIQIRRDLSPAWGIKPIPVTFVATGHQIPKGAWPVLVFDDSDMQGALGYHSVGPDGLPYGRCFANTARQNRVPLSTLISHELVEPAINPYVDQWRNGVALEVGDPVESDSYHIGVRLEEDEGRLHQVAVSDFALPSWWTAGSKGPWDLMHRAPGPLRVAPGGYAVTQQGTVFGEEYPEWRKWTKIVDGSRTLRVIADGATRHQELRNELAALDRAA